MRYRIRTLMVLAVVSLILAGPSCVGQSSKTPAATSGVVYSSPIAAFNAYRDALSKRALRKCFQCLTPEAQADAIFETYFACGMLASDEVATLCKKYVGDPDTFHREYERRYKEKHGVSIEEVRAKEQAEPPRGPTATSDRELLVEVLNARIQDRAGFYEAANNLIEHLTRDPADQNTQRSKQELRDVVVKGDKATGTIDVVVISYHSSPGEPMKREESKYPRILHFRKLNGGWLIDLY
jgi:hypothetical protein